MWIVKLGGSLMHSPSLPVWLKLLTEKGGGEVVIVPGGGLFADQVRKAQRRWHFGDTTAHKMALRAMEQFGLMLLSLESRICPATSIEGIRDTLNKGQVPIWFPYAMVAGNPEIEATWDITSDSLSLWLAETLGCRNLAIVKSAVPVDGDYSVEALSRNGHLDRAFAKMMSGTYVKPLWLHHRQLKDFSLMLCHRNYSSGAVKSIT
jgi:5-(aminomethyl)-3-furanmethanol phosphate kinase